MGPAAVWGPPLAQSGLIIESPSLSYSFSSPDVSVCTPWYFTRCSTFVQPFNAIQFNSIPFNSPPPSHRWYALNVRGCMSNTEMNGTWVPVSRSSGAPRDLGVEPLGPNPLSTRPALRHAPAGGAQHAVWVHGGLFPFGASGKPKWKRQMFQ